MLELDDASPIKGAEVFIRRGTLEVGGEIAFSGGMRYGVRFENAVHVQDWMAHTPDSGQERVDQLLTQVSATPFSPAKETLDRVSALLPKNNNDHRLMKVIQLLQEVTENLSNNQSVITRRGLALRKKLTSHFGI